MHVAQVSSSSPNRLKRLDIVLCPVICNGHVACKIVKKLGKKHKKRVRTLAICSLSTVYQLYL
jgi:hypothetical protein